MAQLKVIEIISIAVGTASTLAGLWKYILVPSWNFIKKVSMLIQKVEDHSNTLDLIANEFKSNDAGTLRGVLDKVEYHLASSDSKIKALIAYHNVGVFEADPQGQCTWVSKRWCTLSGLMPHEAMGNGWVLSIHEDDRDRVYDEWITAAEQKRDFNTNYRTGNQIIGYTVVNCKSSAIKTDKGLIIGYFSIIEELN